MTRVFLSRLASSLVLWTVALWTVFSGYEIGFFSLIFVLGMAALWEFYGMLDHSDLPNFKCTAMICGAVMMAGSFHYSSTGAAARCQDFEVLAVFGFLIVVFTRQMFKGLRDVAPVPTMAYTLFGLMYVIWMFNFMNKIVYVSPRTVDHMVTGQFYVLFLMVVTKFSDMGAYIVGTCIGKHLWVPHISPKKTWEGFFGALAFSTAASYGLVRLMPGHLALLNGTHAIILGLLLGFAGVVGDLAESVLKRGTGVKDSGRMLPGIGGALDLVDSLLFTAPLLFMYLREIIGVQ